MNNTKMAILITLFTCTSQGKKHYSLVSVNKIIILLTKIHETQVKRRWVFQCLKDIIKNGYLSRKPRYKRHSNGHINQLSSITAITLKGAKLLLKKRISGASLLMKRIIAWTNTQDNRFPKEADVMDGLLEERDPLGARRLKALTSNVLKPS